MTKILLFLLTFYPSIALDNFFDYSNIRAGFNPSYLRVYNSSNLPIIAYTKACGVFNSGTASGFSIGGNIKLNVKNTPLSVFSGLNYSTKPALLEKTLDDMEVYDNRLETYVPLVRDYTFDANLQYIGVNFGVGIKPLKKYQASINLALNFDYPFINSSYEKSESVVSPEGMSFPGNGSDSRTFERGDLENPNLSAGLSVGANYDFKMKNGIIVSPGINYRYPLNSTVIDDDWLTSTLQFETNFLWEFDLTSEILVDTIPEPIIKHEPEAIAADIIPMKKDKNFIKYFSSIPLNIQETIVTQTYPLLPYIFFDSASAELKDVYQDQIVNLENFIEDSLPKNTLGIYYSMLDIVGYRLNKESNALLTIKGLTDGKEFQHLEERLKLAEQRAEAVRNYLLEKWKISKDRLIIKKQDYPDLPTSELYPEGMEENRRVELLSDSYTILSPVSHSRFIENSSNQNKILFYAGFEDARMIKTLDIFFYSNDERIYGYHEEEHIRDGYNINLNNILLNRIAQETGKSDSLTVEIGVTLENGKYYTRKSYLAVNKSLNKFELGRLNLIVFDFDKWEISDENRFMIDNFVKTSIKDNSNVIITGSSDILGEEDYNLKLSQKRAENTKNYLTGFQEELSIEDVKGIGSSILPYDNAKPEGRFYCRTVLIEVKTPLNK